MIENPGDDEIVGDREMGDGEWYRKMKKSEWRWHIRDLQKLRVSLNSCCWPPKSMSEMVSTDETHSIKVEELDQ
jgi:hypothetical protein